MKRCLIVVDYQEDFVTGSLGFAGAVALEDKIFDKICRRRDSGWDIIFTLDTHGENYMMTREGRYLPVSHCVDGTSGYELYGRVKECRLENDRCFRKSDFGSGELYEYLKQSDYDSAELVGVVTDICVIANAVLARTALPEADITVDASCVASSSEDMNRKALDVMESLQINVTNRSGGESNG